MKMRRSSQKHPESVESKDRVRRIVEESEERVREFFQDFHNPPSPLAPSTGVKRPPAPRRIP
jgi:hypothetical protein